MGVKSNKNKAYRVWKSMMQRCYKEHFHTHHPTYSKCTVDSAWHNFNEFENWFNKNYIEDFYLDKDVLVQGNNIYSKDTCCFLPKEINSFCNIKQNKKYSGVKERPNNRFQSRIRFEGKELVLGTFSTKEKAFNKYINKKEEVLNLLIQKYKYELPLKVVVALKNYNFRYGQ